jgi:hypothetical protein
MEQRASCGGVALGLEDHGRARAPSTRSRSIVEHGVAGEEHDLLLGGEEGRLRPRVRRAAQQRQRQRTAARA